MASDNGDIELKVVVEDGKDDTTDDKDQETEKSTDNPQNRGNPTGGSKHLMASNPKRNSQSIFYPIEDSNDGTSSGHCDDVADIQRSLSTISQKNKGPIDAFIVLYESGLSKKLSWEAQIEEAVRHESDEFWKQVALKTQETLINQTDAIFEVYTDRVVKKSTRCDKALLWILSQAISEFSAELFVTRLLQRGAKTVTMDAERNTSLHYAAEKGWTSIAKKLVEHNGALLVINKNGFIPLELAIHNDRNECASFLVKSMEPIRVRNLFQADLRSSCKLKFHALLENKNMKETVLAVLDTMIQPALQGEQDTYIVYYHILDGDQHGRAPNHPDFDGSSQSCLHKIAERNYKEVVYHNVIRLLIRQKWNQFVRNRLLSQFIFYIIHTIIMTLALVLAARKIDPREYDDSIDIFRGICEVLFFLSIMYNVFVEVYQFKRHKLNYFRDYFNYLDNGAILFPILIVPFRITNLSVQWIFASIGYLCQTLRGLEFTAVFRTTGAYVQIIYIIFVQDMVPFIAIFSFFLFSFTGAFYFALRGEEFSTTVVTASNCSSEIDDEICVQNFTTVESSSLDIYPHLTEEYYHVLFSNLRVMVEAEDIIDEYFGPDGFGWLSVIIYTVFLFLVITVLLNLLIAQMSDTYTNVQSDAHRSLVINWAWIVSKIEHNSLFASALFDYRKKYYVNFEIVDNPHNLLDEWEAVPPISQVSKDINKLHDSIKQQEAANAQLINELRTELKLQIKEKETFHVEIQKLQSLIEQKETAHTEFRTEMMKVLNEQKQLICKLISNRKHESEV